MLTYYREIQTKLSGRARTSLALDLGRLPLVDSKPWLSVAPSCFVIYDEVLGEKNLPRTSLALGLGSTVV